VTPPTDGHPVALRRLVLVLGAALVLDGAALAVLALRSPTRDNITLAVLASWGIVIASLVLLRFRSIALEPATAGRLAGRSVLVMLALGFVMALGTALITIVQIAGTGWAWLAPSAVDL
jgi:hypothetical protein